MMHLRENETVELIIRKHWFVVAKEVVIFIILLIVPIIVLIFLPPLLTQFNADENIINPLINFFLSLYVLIPLAYLFLMWMDYYLDMWIITNERIVDIEQKGLFNREISEIPLHRVQDVTIHVNGIIETLLRFGTIKIQTAGERDFEIRFVPNLYKAKDIILQYIKTAHQNERAFKMEPNKTQEGSR
jgi:uncharacterized membrane protein YdbT with pleckstrin-like domain